ncbi:MAG TPA: glycoside hydrolase domain-containing protein, partial [Actinomycetota bacterium]
MRRVEKALLLAASVLAALALAPPAVAGAAGGDRTIHFAGEQVRIPAGWPLIRLAERPRACVRLDRRAVFIGTPSPRQNCPAEAIGRRRAILVDPRAEARATSARAEASRTPPARISASAEFTGLGFDACAAPSRSAMRAWDSSPYRAIGVYIGGLNRACSQPNLTASWVAEQVAAGWHLIPTYVGLQAPTSSCSSCAKLSSGSATLQGAAAATDAVEQARATGIGPGSPIYFDMESYSRTSSATNATLTFL